MSLFDFENSTDGWHINSFSDVFTRLSITTTLAFSGTGSLQMDVDLGNRFRHESGEIYYQFDEARNYDGLLLQGWVYAPAGARGDNEFSNGLRFFVEDNSGNKLYASWHNIWQEGWYSITLPIRDAAPACGTVSAGFDPTEIRRIGINLAANTTAGAAASYVGPILLDSIAIGVPEPFPSDHLHTFSDPDSLDGLPRFETDPGWNALGWESLAIQNEALTVEAEFNTSTDPTRKGFFSIIYSPYLNLSHKEHATISLDLRFSPNGIGNPPLNCPFVISVWVWDDIKQKWFTSEIQQVGSGEWQTVTFNLLNQAELAPGVPAYEGDLPTLSNIRRIGFQIYANQDYAGLIQFDNIAFGGLELPNQYPNQNSHRVQRNGNQFALDGRRFRFVSYDIEYLFTLPEDDVVQLLDTVAALPGDPVVRLWGFSEGCEALGSDCAVYSRYFQPERGVFNETVYEHFDRIVAMAGARGIRLIIALGNNWHEYGGAPQYVDWLAEEHPDEIPAGIEPHSDEYHDLFFTEPIIKEWYKAAIHKMVTRVNTITQEPYATTNTIMAWELINEARAKSDVSGAAVHSWLAEMAAYVDGLESKSPHWHWR